MLGEKIGEERGSIKNVRVLEPDAMGPRMEVSAEHEGTLLGVKVHDQVTYIARPRPDGKIAGTGRGITTGPDGMVTWHAEGVGTPKAPGSQAVSWRGTVFYEAGGTGKLARLAEHPVVFEYEVDEKGGIKAQSWIWK